jgi:MGT family glycosyltransferase
MKRRHAAIFTLMGNGHLYPILPLCNELIAHGLRVSVPVNTRYAARVHATGAETVVFTELPVDPALRTENEARAELLASDPSRLETSELEWAHLSKSTADLLAQVMGFYEQDPPDLVLYNRYCIPGRIVAHRHRGPAVQFSPHFAYPGRSRFWQDGTCKNPDGLVSYGEKLDSLLAVHDIPTGDNLWHTEKLNLHFIPREFQYRANQFDDRFFFSGSLLQRPFEPLWRPPQPSKPLVLVSSYSGLPETRSSDGSYFKLFIEALADSDCHCVLSVGESVSVSSLGRLPANVEVNQSTSHLEILPCAALFACHGGMGSSLEALYNGVPVLAIPNSPYTEEVGQRVKELRVGEVLPRSELCAATIRDIVSAMLRDISLHERAAELRQVFSRSGGAAAAAQRIERFLQDTERADSRRTTSLAQTLRNEYPCHP